MMALVLLLLLSLSALVVDGLLSPHYSWRAVNRRSVARNAFDNDSLFGGISDKDGNSRDGDNEEDLNAQLQGSGDGIDEIQQALYVPSAERLGTPVINSEAPLKLENLIVKETMESVKRQLLEDGKVCACEWAFDNFKDAFFYSEVERSFLGFDAFIEDLTRREPMQSSASKTSDINGEVSAQVVQIIDPRAVASMIIKARILQLVQAGTQLPLILKENAEAAIFSGMCLAEGGAVAGREKKGVFNPGHSDAFKASFERMSVFVTNIAITRVRDALIAEGKVAASQYMTRVVDEVVQADMMNSIIRDAFESHSVADSGRGKKRRAWGGGSDVTASSAGPRGLLERLLVASLRAEDAESSSRGGSTGGSPTRMLYSRNANSNTPPEASLPGRELSGSARYGGGGSGDGADRDAELEGLGQRLIDSRAEIAATMLTAINILKESSAQKVEGQNRLMESLGGFSEVTLDGGMVSPSLDSFRFLPVEQSPAFSMEVTDPDLVVGSKKNSGDSDGDSDDAAAALVAVRSSGGTAGQSSSDSGLSIGGAGTDSGRRGWRAEDGSQTKADPSGMRATTALLDPPPCGPPEPPIERESSIDESDGRNNVDYRDVDHGSIDDFLNIGPARIRLVDKKMSDDGERLLCLEAAGPQVPGGSFRRWVRAEDALLLLQADSDGAAAGEGDSAPGEAHFGSILLM